MIQINNVTLTFGKKNLFENVNLKFTDGNCYGIIGANGAGKSTFLKLISKELETTHGEIIITKNAKISSLKQDHYQFDNNTVMDTVLMGNKRLYQIMKEKEQIYSKDQFTDEDGMLIANLETEFGELDGWNAEIDASNLLESLNIPKEIHYMLMKDIQNNQKVKVLLAQALFGNPDILLLDEPTNNLDIQAVNWLEEFIINYPNTVIVVSHDRYFLNKVCTHIVDIDYGKMKMYIGNYDFWYESSQLALKQMKESNKKKEEKIKELKDFIARFSANASKSKQATSRKKLLEKIELDEIIPSSRKYPYIDFKANIPSGTEILTVHKLSKKIDGKQILNNISFTVKKGDKIAFVGLDNVAKTTLFKILMQEEKYDSGTITWGKTKKATYFPQDNTNYFNEDETLIKWLSKYYNANDEQEIRNFLGRMLFSGDDVFKKVNVLSGGEKARCMLSKCMIEQSNMLILDEPTNHLDLESITSLNNGLIRYQEEILFTSHDHQLLQSVANRIIEITENGVIDRYCTYDEYMDTRNKQ